MKVTLIAHTSLTIEGFVKPNEYSIDPIIEKLGMEVDEEATSADALAEFSGRSCYQSFHKPNPKTAANADYIANILAQGHESVLEHASATFYVTGVSRYLTHELIRHRHGSWSQLSTRYVDESDAEIVRHPGMDDQDWAETVEHFAASQELYTAMVERKISRGQTRKEARESARFVLPGGLETKIVMTGNMRSFRDIIKKRWHVAADKEIQQLAGELLRQLRLIAPATFSDFPDKPFGSDER